MSTLRQYIRHRYDTGANWTAANPVLRAGELGIESDAASLRGKYGDGTTAWASLPYTELGRRPDFEAVTFDIAASVDVDQAQLAWNVDEQTLDLGKGGGVVLQVGSEQLMLCRNSTATEIPNGRAVRFAGTLGNSGRLLVAPMVADGSLPGYVFFGVTTAAIASGEDGFVTTFGKVRQVNTLAFEEGDILWCDPATPGGLTATEPAAPNLKLPIAAVISKATNGILMVRADTGRRLQDLHDVEANGSKTDGDVLTYIAASNRWEPVSPNMESGLPTGGDPGNILIKQTNANYAADWVATLDGGTFN
ncbi:MAG: hypothetical protein EBZ29_01730 [Synechococcaceae bacterium WB9_4xC_028]|nr:hypothetical protein [Synechococcaceae bacterium WB9_4xC_028]